MPSGQSKHAVCDGHALNRPGRQSRHAVAPLGTYRPGAQPAQCVAPAAEYWPSAQRLHACACASSLKRPAGHASQPLLATLKALPGEQRGVGAGVGCAVGLGDGRAVGDAVGASVGAGDGCAVGGAVGDGVGARVGTGVGALVGDAVGRGVGAADGAALGASVGLGVGTATHCVSPRLPPVHVCGLQEWQCAYPPLAWYWPLGQW